MIRQSLPAQHDSDASGRRRKSGAFPAALLLLHLVVGRSVFAQGAPGPSVGAWGAMPSVVDAPQAGELAIPDAVDSTSTASPDAKRGEFVIAPIPMINPTLDNGIALIVGELYRLDRTDRVTPPSVTLGAVFKTSNGSWGAAAAQQLHLHRDRYRVMAAVAYASVNYDFFGIGQDAGESNRSIPLAQDGTAGLAGLLIRVGGHWYAGARYQLMDMSVAIAEGALPDTVPALPARDRELRTAALGPRVELDTRDNPFYARRGVLLNAMASFYGEGVGGQRSYQGYQASISQYLSLGTRSVVAWRASACDATGDVPFYDLCQLGKSQDLRGYVVGQYRDGAMVASQLEYRQQLPWRLGATAFVGAGAVAAGFDALSAKDTLPAGGAGLRYTLAQRNHVNLRVDYAWGKASHALYISVGEAF